MHWMNGKPVSSYDLCFNLNSFKPTYFWATIWNSIFKYLSFMFKKLKHFHQRQKWVFIEITFPLVMSD
jgi:hypothetical protein